LTSSSLKGFMIASTFFKAGTSVRFLSARKL
jgi:hypothetical protein